MIKKLGEEKVGKSVHDGTRHTVVQVAGHSQRSGENYRRQSFKNRSKPALKCIDEKIKGAIILSQSIDPRQQAESNVRGFRRQVEKHTTVVGLQLRFENAG